MRQTLIFFGLFFQLTFFGQVKTSFANKAGETILTSNFMFGQEQTAEFVVEFVFKTINKSDEIGHLKDNQMSKGSTVEITEKLTHYYVEVSD